MVNPYISFQKVVHADLSHLLRFMKLLQRLPDLFIWNFPLTFLLIVKIQPASFKFFQMVLRKMETLSI